jgi:hypothetical protein
MPSTYTPIATQTLGSNAATVTFSSISGSYTDLRIVINGGITIADANTYVRVGNGSVDTGSNYSGTYVEGRTGTSANSGRFTSTSFMQLDYYGSMSTTNSTLTIDFLNYANTTTYKNSLVRYGNTTSASYSGVGALVGLWRSTSAINIMTFSLGSGNFKTGCTFTLYGVKSA